MSPEEGVLRVDKPEGPTSHDVVALARRALRMRRIGHTGTLDPFASGLLLLCLGRATRLAEYLSALPKSYLGVVRLGETTDTDDHTGEVLARSESVGAVSRADVERALAAQTGTVEQLPPLYSAKKVGGERMYAAARRGEDLGRTPVRVTIHRLELLRFDPPDLEIAVDCSSGTYIRAIARDLGQALGTGGHLTALRRTAIGPHRVEGAVPSDRLGDAGAVSPALLTPVQALAHLQTFEVGDEQARAVANGVAVPAPPDLPEGLLAALTSADGSLLAVAERRGPVLRPRKVFA